MINIRITDIDRPHCNGCGSYCKVDSTGKSINLNYGHLTLCDPCYDDLVTYIIRLEKKKLEVKKEDDSDTGMEKK